MHQGNARINHQQQASMAMRHVVGLSEANAVVTTTTTFAFISWQSRHAVNRSNGSRDNDTMNWSVLEEAIPKSSLSTALNVRTRGDISPGDQSQSGAEKTNTTSADDQQPLQLLGPALLTPWTNPVPSLHRDRCDSVTQPTLFTKFLPSQPFHWSQATVILLIGLYIKTPRCISYLVHVDGMKRRHKSISGRPTFSSPPSSKC